MREQSLHAALARHLAGTSEVGSAARHMLAAGDAAGAFELLSDRVLWDFSANPRRGSPLDLDELEPEMFAGRPEFLLPLALELLLRGAFERGSRAGRSRPAGKPRPRHSTRAGRETGGCEFYALLLRR